MEPCTAERKTLEAILAVRMACSNPDVTGVADAPPVLVFPAPEGKAAVTAAGADKTAEAVAGYVRSNRRLPATVGVAGCGVFAVAPCTGPRRRLDGCIAIVTGAAQGFGRGIVEELVAEGARVTVADINDALGAALADELNRAAGQAVALYSHADVTSLASLEACVAATARRFGGLDMLVSNAGVLKAGGLDEMDERAFDLVTQVNYKAFFLAAKAAAPLMKRQHGLNPHHFMDIIQINSKSGLEGSNRNFAYAGSKFGSIGLTQSFALELVGHHVKVNAICPGNYFEGPLWSDPEKGLFVQYLRAGKVPGAKTVEDVRKFYMSKVPMGRGCTPRDVARAIFYLHDQLYETGQAVPVTGGQVMLR